MKKTTVERHFKLNHRLALCRRLRSYPRFVSVAFLPLVFSKKEAREQGDWRRRGEEAGEEGRECMRTIEIYFERFFLAKIVRISTLTLGASELCRAKGRAGLELQASRNCILHKVLALRLRDPIFLDEKQSGRHPSEPLSSFSISFSHPFVV